MKTAVERVCEGAAEQRDYPRLAAQILDSLSESIIQFAAKVAPARAVDVYPHRLWARNRPRWYFDVFLSGPGWLFIEFGGWTVEVAWNTREELAA